MNFATSAPTSVALGLTRATTLLCSPLISDSGMRSDFGVLALAIGALILIFIGRMISKST